LDSFEIRVYQDRGREKLHGVIGLVAPANKDHARSRRTFATKFATYLHHGVGPVIIDIVTSQTANLHRELFDVLDMSARCDAWESPTGLYAAAYRAVTDRTSPRMEVWTERLTLGSPLPVLPLWLTLDLCVPVHLEESYLATCQSLRISA